MKRTFLMLTIAGLAVASVSVGGCTMTPAVTKQRMTLAEANIQDMECRRQTAVTSNIPKTICASETVWKKWDAKQADISAAFYDDTRDGDNRVLYRGR